MSKRKLKIKRKYTNRGFRLLLFKDDYLEDCSLQDSSLVEPHVWLGVDQPKMLKGNDLVKLPEGMAVFSRMHLNQKQARQLAEELLYFAENGHLRDKEASNEREG